MTENHAGRVHLTPDDYQRLRTLRRQSPAEQTKPGAAGRGAKLADRVAMTVGSWRFIAIQSVLLAFWITLNVTAYVRQWDPYPFILLNLVLSFQAAYTAPVIMMSQNRQSDIDRGRAELDYHVNVKAELEIELLHQKIDMMREQEITKLTLIIERLLTRLEPRPEDPDGIQDPV